MNLAPEVVTHWRCLTCGYLHDHWPETYEQPCCVGPAAFQPDDRLLTVADCADLAGVAKSTVAAWIASGQLQAFRQGQVVRVRPADWQTFVEAN